MKTSFGSCMGGLMLAAGLVATGAQAALIEQDLAVPGDGKVTFDTVSGLRWLDLTLSVPQAINSANAFTAAGWSVANLSQVQTLIGNHFGSSVTNGQRQTVPVADAQSFASLFGVTYAAEDVSWGRFQSPTSGRAGQAIVRYDALTSYLIDDNVFANTDPHSFSGVFYVMAVPEPEVTAMLLAGLGLVGFAARRRKTAA